VVSSRETLSRNKKIEHHIRKKTSKFTFTILVGGDVNIDIESPDESPSKIPLVSLGD